MSHFVTVTMKIDSYTTNQRHSISSKFDIVDWTQMCYTIPMILTPIPCQLRVCSCVRCHSTQIHLFAVQSFWVEYQCTIKWSKEEEKNHRIAFMWDWGDDAPMNANAHFKHIFYRLDLQKFQNATIRHGCVSNYSTLALSLSLTCEFWFTSCDACRQMRYTDI